MRSDAREAAFKITFASLFHGDCDEHFRSSVYKKQNLTQEECTFAERLVRLTTEHREELLAELGERITRYAEYRIFPADKAILMVALVEIKFCEDVPNVVAVSEATDLARKFSTENSANFVNGVLAGVINS